jgi:hypothetical protein
MLGTDLPSREGGWEPGAVARPTSPFLLGAFVILYAKAVKPERLRNAPGLCLVTGRLEVSGGQAGIEPALSADVLPQG